MLKDIIGLITDKIPRDVKTILNPATPNNTRRELLHQKLNARAAEKKVDPIAELCRVGAKGLEKFDALQKAAEARRNSAATEESQRSGM